MQTKPIYTFDTVNDLGIDSIPVDSTVVIKDSDGAGTVKQILKINLGVLTSESTVADFLADDTLFKTMGGDSTAPEYTTLSGGTY